MNYPVSEKVNFFAGGKAEPIYNFNRGIGGNVYSPTGKFKVNPQIKGFEFDLTKSSGFDNDLSLGNIKSGSISKTMSKTLTGNIGSIETSLKNIPKTNLGNIQGNFLKSNKMINTFSKGNTIQTTAQFDRSMQVNRQRSIVLPAQDVVTRTRQNTMQFLSLGGIQITRNNQRQNTGLGLQELSLTKTETPTRTKTILTLNPPNVPSFTVPEFGKDFLIPPIPPPKFNLFDYGKGRKTKQRGFKGRYAPSISAIGLGIFSTKIPKAYLQGRGAFILRPQIFSKIKKHRKLKR